MIAIGKFFTRLEKNPGIMPVVASVLVSDDAGERRYIDQRRAEQHPCLRCGLIRPARCAFLTEHRYEPGVRRVLDMCIACGNELRIHRVYTQGYLITPSYPL